MAELVCHAYDPAWLEYRRAGVTATDITAIIGLSPYDSLYSVYWRKVAGIEQPRSDRLDLGAYLEDYIAGRFYASLGADASCVIGPSALYRNGERPWQLATPDATLAYEPYTHGGEPVEYKSWGTTDGWGDDGSDLIPLVVRAQLLWQMDVLGSAAGRVGCLFVPSGKFRSYRVEHQSELCMEFGTGSTDLPGYYPCDVCTDQRAMRVAGSDFMNRVANRDVPLVDGSLATLNVLKARHPLALKQPATIPDDLRDGWQAARTARDYGEKAMRELAQRCDAVGR